MQKVIPEWFQGRLGQGELRQRAALVVALAGAPRVRDFLTEIEPALTDAQLRELISDLDVAASKVIQPSDLFGLDHSSMGDPSAWAARQLEWMKQSLDSAYPWEPVRLSPTRESRLYSFLTIRVLLQLGVPKEILVELRAPSEATDAIRRSLAIDSSFRLAYLQTPPWLREALIAKIGEVVNQRAREDSRDARPAPGTAILRPLHPPADRTRIPDDMVRETLGRLQSAQEHSLPGEWADLGREVVSRLGWSFVELSETSEPLRFRVDSSTPEGKKSGVLRLPRWELLGLEKSIVASRARGVLETTDDMSPVVVTGEQLPSTTHELFPGRLSARTFDNSPRFTDLHLRNLATLAGSALAAERMTFVNLIPSTEAALERMDLAGSPRRWEAVSREFDEAAARSKVRRAPADTTRNDLLNYLSKGELDLLVLVAHGTRDSISLKDGTELSVSDILDLTPFSGTRAPVVVLVACDTGKTEKGSRSVAQALLLRGYASAVLAPSDRVPATSRTVEFVESLLHRSGSAAQLFSQVPPGWQLWVNRATETEGWLPIRRRTGELAGKEARA